MVTSWVLFIVLLGSFGQPAIETARFRHKDACFAAMAKVTEAQLSVARERNQSIGNTVVFCVKDAVVPVVVDGEITW